MRAYKLGMMRPPKNKVAGYFGNIYKALTTVAAGMGVTIKVFFQRPVTLQYPDEFPVIEEAFRGLHIYEQEKCIACEMCVKVCPIDCIFLDYEGKGKKARIKSYKVDYTKCLFCNLCVEICPTNCIKMGKEYDLSSYDREGCVRELAKDIYSDDQMVNE